MRINFFYVTVDSSVNDLMIIYNYLRHHSNDGVVNGATINLIDVSSTTLDAIEKAMNSADVNIVDIMVKKITLHDYQSTPCNTVIEFRKSPQHYLNAYEILLKSQSCKIFFGQSFDLHWHGIDLDSLSHFDALFWIYEKKPIALEQTEEKYRETFNLENGEPIDVWKKVTSMMPSRAEIPFCVAPIRKGSQKKLFDYTVAGCVYKTRIRAIEQLRNTSLRKAPFDTIEFGIQLMTRMLKKTPLSPSKLNKFYIRARQSNYNSMIYRSQMSFACGSFLKYPVRKFFQVPNFGSLLLAYPCTGFNDYGFKHEENCLEVTPENVADFAEYISSHPNKLERITQAGHELIQSEHSIENRVSQIIECAKKVYQGKTINAQYIEGKYQIDC